MSIFIGNILWMKNILITMPFFYFIVSLSMMNLVLAQQPDVKDLELTAAPLEDPGRRFLVGLFLFPVRCATGTSLLSGIHRYKFDLF